MNTLMLNVRLISAVIAAATTLGLFGAVVSLAEPQRSELIAKNQRSHKLATAPTAVAMASPGVTQKGQ